MDACILNSANIEIKRFKKGGITKPTKDLKDLLCMADLESSEIKISGAYCAIQDICAKLEKMCSYGDLQGAGDSARTD